MLLKMDMEWSFSAHNAETIVAILEAAEEKQAPVMIQIGQKVIDTLGLKPMKDMVDSFSENYACHWPFILKSLPGNLNKPLSHTLGFQSVMFDGLPCLLKENITITTQRVAAARALGIGSEGEIGENWRHRG